MQSDSGWLPADRVRPDPDNNVQIKASRENSWFPVEILETRKALNRWGFNQRIEHIRRMFKRDVSEELVPSSFYEPLRAVAWLRRGNEKSKVRPVSNQHVKATLNSLNPQGAAIVRLQRLIGGQCHR